MSIAGYISSRELKDLLLSLAALVVAFSVLIGGRSIPGLEMVLIIALGVGTGFILHEMAHKFTALHFGYLAEYRANMTGLFLAVALSFAGFIFAAPGAVMISRYRPVLQAYIPEGLPSSNGPHPFQQEELASRMKREMLLISLAGPMTNIVLAAGFFILKMSGLAGEGIWAHAVGFAISINLILAAFNMLPFGPLDGKKIFDADRRVWALVALPAILIALSVYFGI